MNRLVLVVIAIGFISVVSLWMISTPALGTDYDPDVCAMRVAGPESEFIEKCQACHFARHSSWAKTPRGKALKASLPGEKVDGPMQANRGDNVKAGCRDEKSPTIETGKKLDFEEM